MFKDIVDNQKADCIFENGQWHVPDYRGITTAVGNIDEAGHKVRRMKAGIDDQEQLGVLVAQGAKLVDSSAAASSRSVQAKVPDKMPDYPMINRNQNDQASIQPAPKLIMEEILREVANANTYCCSMEAQRVGST